MTKIEMGFAGNPSPEKHNSFKYHGSQPWYLNPNVKQAEKAGSPEDLLALELVKELIGKEFSPNCALVLRRVEAALIEALLQRGYKIASRVEPGGEALERISRLERAMVLLQCDTTSYTESPGEFLETMFLGNFPKFHQKVRLGKFLLTKDAVWSVIAVIGIGFAALVFLFWLIFR